MTTEPYSPPPARLGDTVYWYNDPISPQDPQLGWINERPGTSTVSILVFAPGLGFVEKSSVRHRDDPGLRENPAWRQWGCWDFSDAHKDLLRAQKVSAAVALSHERDNKKAAPNGAK